MYPHLELHQNQNGPMETLQCENSAECDDWYNLFRMLDTDNDGYIPIRELNAVVRTSAYQFGLKPRETEILLHGIDVDGDQLIDFPEFTSMMYRAKHMHLRRFMLYTARSVLPKGQQVEATRYLLEYNCWPPPFFIVLISLIQLVMYILQQFDCDSNNPLKRCSPMKWLLLNPCRKTEIWRYFSYMFVHAGYVHLVSNLVMQLLLGVPLELVHKWWRISSIYLIGVASGAILFFFFAPSGYLAGASGGGYTLLSAHIANVVINWNEMEFNWIRAGILVMMVLTDVGNTVYQKYYGFTNNVSIIAHLGGFIAGLLLGVVILRNLRKLKWESYAWWISLVVFGLLVCFCVFIITARELANPTNLAPMCKSKL